MGRIGFAIGLAVAALLAGLFWLTWAQGVAAGRARLQAEIDRAAAVARAEQHRASVERSSVEATIEAAKVEAVDHALANPDRDRVCFSGDLMRSLDAIR